VLENDLKANCSLKVFPQADPSKYIQVLSQPGDLQSFPCSRTVGIEHHSFQVPSKFVCSFCTLQLLVQGNIGSRFACADILVNVGKIQCRCKNKGICIDGICQCPVGITGEFCEISENREGLWPVIFRFLLMTLALGVIFLTIFLYMNPQVLPEGVVQFLDRRASWMLRKSGR
jgi:hypothetical protein